MPFRAIAQAKTSPAGRACLLTIFRDVSLARFVHAVVIVHIVSSGPNWLVFALTQVGSFLVGTATAVVGQRYIAPDAETRKRQAQRWEEDVRELSDVLGTRLTDAAGHAWAAQALYREERNKTDDEYRPEVVRHTAREADSATLEFGSVINTQVDRLMGRVVRFNPDDDELKHLKQLNSDYQASAILVRPLSDHDDRTDKQFEEGWRRERQAREALIKQVQVLEGVSPPSPPRRLPWRSHRKAVRAASSKQLRGSAPAS